MPLERAMSVMASEGTGRRLASPSGQLIWNTPGPLEAMRQGRQCKAWCAGSHSWSGRMEDGYKTLHVWRETRKFAHRILLAVAGTDQTSLQYSTVLRNALSASLMPPAALAVAGASEKQLRRTIGEAGLQDLHTLAASLPTLDGAMRVEALLGFE